MGFRTSASRCTYRDRTHAGRVLARRLEVFGDRDDVVVLALPRGGVPVAAPIAAFLHAPFDIVLVRKLGVPDQPELAAGAIAGGDQVVRNDRIIAACGVSDRELATIAEREGRELRRREDAYREGRAPADVAGATAIVVDDGVATGATMRVALQALRQAGARSTIVAVPVGPSGVSSMFADADAVICPSVPREFVGVGGAYDDFRQLTDDEVRRTLREAAHVR